MPEIFDRRALENDLEEIPPGLDRLHEIVRALNWDIAGISLKAQKLHRELDRLMADRDALQEDSRDGTQSFFE